MALDLVYQGIIGSMGLATIVLLITASLIAILYMASKIIQNKGLEAWISNEVFQCLATAVLVFMLVGILSLFSGVMVAFLDEYAKQFATGTSGSEVSQYISQMSTGGYNDLPHMTFARVYLISRLDRLSIMYDYMYSWYVVFSTAGSITHFFPEQLAINIFGATTIAKFIMPFMQYSYYGFLFIYFQLALLELISSYFAVVFPAGLMLRAFPFTRSVGSFLIASAIAIYFVYPFLFSILLLSNYGGALEMSEAQILNIVSRESPSNFLNYYISQLAGGETAVGTDVSTADSLKQATAIISFVQFILLTMILYPLVAIVGAYSFMLQFAQLLQANTSELGRGLIKLI